MKKRKSRKTQKLWLMLLALIVIVAIGISNDNIRNYIEEILEGQDVLAVATNAIGDIGKQRAESTKVSFSLDTIPNLSLKGVVSAPAFVVAPISVNFGKSSLIDLALGPFPIIISNEKSSKAGYKISSTCLLNL